MTTPDCSSDELGTPVMLILRDDAGNDIDTLHIHGPQYGAEGVTLLEGYENFYHPDFTLPRESGAYQKGSTPGIVRDNERQPTFTLGTQAPTPARWEGVENRLWKFLSPYHECILRLFSLRSDPREIPIRLERKPKDLLKRGPGLIRFAAWEIVAVGCDPDWQSEQLKFTLTRSQMTSLGNGVYEGFFPIQNPADQGCYPIFASSRLTTTTTFTLPDRDTGRSITIGPLVPGQEILVRTDPLLPTVLTRNRTLGPWVSLAAKSFDADPIDGGLVNPVMASVRITGGAPDTAITMYLPQRWSRCWGGEV